MSLAWILDFGGGRRGAVAHSQQLQLVHQPEVHALAFAPPHAQQLLRWNERGLPLLDFGLWSRQQPTGNSSLVGIYAYVPRDGSAHRLGALWLAAPPVVAEVDDAQACELPAECASWRAACLSCFRDERFGAVPILDLTAVFDSPLPESVPSAAA